MAVVLLAAFLIIACLLALRFEKQLTAVLPLATCILILILYVLAFFRRLSWIDYFSTAIVVGAVLRVLFLSGEKKKKLFAQLRELFFAPSAIAAMVLLTGALLGHFDLGQVALAAAHIVAALADITGNADVFHIYHLSVHSMACGQGVYSGKFSQPFSLRA